MKTIPLKPVASSTAISLREERNLRIRADFNDMYSKGQRASYILAILKGRYFLAEETLEKIVFARGRYKSGSAPASSARPTA